MEWTKQAEDMFKTWAETQQKMWDEWLKTMKGFGKSQPTDVWGKSVDALEDALKRTLDAQVEWTRLWASSLTTVSGAPREMAEWARQGQDMVRRWAEAQKQLWDGWFQTVRKLDPAALGGNWDQDGQKFFKAWQEGVQKALDAQAEWARPWTEQAPGKKSKDPKGAQA